MELSLNNKIPIDLFFGDMRKLGPGSDADTLHILSLLPNQRGRIIVDAGCGTGRQTLLLAKNIGTPVHAVDLHEPFLKHLLRRATEEGISHLIEVHCMNMKDIPEVFPHIDLLWSEGAAYNIGFADALKVWASAIIPGGFAAISELSWLYEQVPNAVREFFRSGYPDMKSVQQNIAIAERAGYKVLTTHTLPRETWVEGYYDILAQKAKSLLDHPDSSVRNFAAEIVREIEIFSISEDNYGYVFYALQLR